MLVIIDPGHGGWDPGGGSNNLWLEKDKTLQISQYQKRRFDELGIPSTLTRTSDETLSPAERIRRINSLIVDDTLVLSNHINSGGGKGAEVIHSIRDQPTWGLMIAAEVEKTGQNIRNVYTRRNSLGNDYYFIIRETPNAETIIMEYGFADNKDDQQRLLYNWAALAEAVVRGTANYLNVPYTPPNFISYTVRQGDSLYTVARNFNTTIDKLKRDNGLTTNTIYPGQQLFIYR
ncbi:MAG: N-acetylmuramoyl-L-alanine amidase [Bacilli bacterium]|nr:N-acetylmuramoyl-L-alanine amidase [Bacilli bacterium]